MKRAIKILLALAVTVTMFVVVTVVASAADYVYVDREDWVDYAYVPGMSIAEDQVVFVESGTFSFYDLWFESLCSTEPNSIWIYSGAADPYSTEDYYFNSGDGSSYSLYNGVGFGLLYSSSGSPLDVLSCFYVYPVEKLPVGSSSGSDSSGGSNDSGSTDSGSDSSGGSTDSGSSDVITSGSGRDEYAWIYDPTVAKSGAFDEYDGVVDLPAFYVLSDCDYSYFLEEAWSLIKSAEGYSATSFLWSDVLPYTVYTMTESEWVNYGGSYDPFEPVNFPAGEYVVMIPLYCGDNDSDFIGYQHFYFYVNSSSVLPSHPSEYYEAYDRGYTEGYSNGFYSGQNSANREYYYDGYDVGYDEGYSEGMLKGDDLMYDSGYVQGVIDGNVTGYDKGYSEGYDGGYSIGVVEGSNIGYDSGYDHGYDYGYGVGYDQGAFEVGVNADGEYSAGYQAGLYEGLNTTMSEGGNPVSGFFSGIVSGTIKVFQYVVTNIHVGTGDNSMTLLDAIEFIIFFLVAAFVVKRIIFGAINVL